MIFLLIPLGRTTPGPGKDPPDPKIEATYQRHVRIIMRVTAWAICAWVVALGVVLLLGPYQ